MKLFSMLFVLCGCLLFLGSCASPSLDEEITENIDFLKVNFGFPAVCWSCFEEREGGWELEVWWVSENPEQDHLILVDRDGIGKEIVPNPQHIRKLRDFAGEIAALYYVEIQEYMLKPNLRRDDLAIQVGVMTDRSKRFHLIRVSDTPW